MFVGKDENGDVTELTCCDYIGKGDSLYLICGNTAGEVLIIHYGRFEVVERKKIAVSEMVSIRNCNASKRVVAISADGIIHHWTENSLLKEDIMPNFYRINIGSEVTAFCMDPLFTEGLFGTAQGIFYVNINEVYSSALVGNITTPPLMVKIINDKHFVTSHQDGRFKLWNMATGEEIRCYKWRGVCTEVLYDEELSKLICFFSNNEQIKIANLKKFTREEIFVHEESVKANYEAEDYPVKAFEAVIAGRRAKWVAFKKGDLYTMSIQSLGKKRSVSLTKLVELKSVEQLHVFEEKSTFFVINEEGMISSLVVDISETELGSYSFMVMDRFHVNEKDPAAKICFGFSKNIPESYFAGQVDQSLIFYRNYIKRLNIMKLSLADHLSSICLYETKKISDIYIGTAEGSFEIINAFEIEERHKVESVINAPIRSISAHRNTIILNHECGLSIYRI